MARAQAVKGRIDSLNSQAEIAVENYDSARQKQLDLLAQVRSDNAKIKRTRNRISTLQTHLNTRASDMYRDGAVSFLDVLLGAKDFSDFAATWDMLRNLNQNDASSVAELKQAKHDLEIATADVSRKERAASAQVGVMASQKQRILSNLSEQKQLLGGIESEIAALDAAAAAQAAADASSNYRQHPDNTNYPHPTIPAHGDVVTYARSRLGCPYQWGASGPNEFDCSGLAMWCYAQVGISLPHSSSAQFSSGQHVSRADLQPGDLVFFGSPIHHVGIYIGGGDMIEAPHSGAVVRIASAFRSDYAGACRP